MQTHFCRLGLLYKMSILVMNRIFCASKTKNYSKYNPTSPPLACPKLHWEFNPNPPILTPAMNPVARLIPKFKRVRYQNLCKVFHRFVALIFLVRQIGEQEHGVIIVRVNDEHLLAHTFAIIQPSSWNENWGECDHTLHILWILRYCLTKVFDWRGPFSATDVHSSQLVANASNRIQISLSLSPIFALFSSILTLFNSF